MTLEERISSLEKRFDALSEIGKKLDAFLKMTERLTPVVESIDRGLNETLPLLQEVKKDLSSGEEWKP